MGERRPPHRVGPACPGAEGCGQDLRIRVAPRLRHANPGDGRLPAAEREAWDAQGPDCPADPPAEPALHGTDTRRGCGNARRPVGAGFGAPLPARGELALTAMLCRTCGMPLPEGRIAEICPQCSFGGALGLGGAGAGPEETIEGYELLHELGRGG